MKKQVNRHRLMAILIADDEEQVRRILHGKLSHEGYNCLEAANEEQIFDKLEENPIELVILDVQMLEKSGLQLLPQIRKLCPDIAIIMATVITDRQTAIQCMRQGAYDFITKPIDLDDLAISVERALDVRQMRLVESGEQYKIIFESANDVLIFVDRQGKILDINEKVKDIGGYEREEFLGKNIRSLTRIMTKKSLAIVVKNFIKRLAGANIPPYEIEMVAKNGELITVEINAVAVRREGRIVGDLAILRDVSKRKRDAETLSESEERYRALIDNAHDMIQSVALDGSFRFVNHAWLKTLGYTESELSDLNMFDIIHPGSLQHCQELFAKVMNGESIQNIEATFVAKDSREVQVEGGATPRILGGKVVATQGIFRDITRRKMVERDIAERIKELTCLYEISQIMARPGATVGEILRETVDLIPPGWQYPEITCARINLYGNEYKTGNFINTQWKQSSDIVVNGKKQGLIDICYLEERPNLDEGPFMEEERNLINAITRMLSEIIERKEADKLLRESEERNRLLLDSAGEAIYGLDVNGNCTFVNKACLQLLGYDSDEDILGKNMHNLIHYKRPDGTVYPQEECKIYQAFRRGEGLHVDDEVLWCADGSSFPAEYWSYPMRRGDQVVGAVMVFTDITERKQAQEMLREGSEKWHSLIENTDDTIVITDNNNVIRYINRTIPPTTPEGVIGKTIYEYVSEEHHNVMTKSLERVYKTGEPDSYEITLDMSMINPEVGTLWFRTKIVPIKSHKEIAGVIMIATDITKRKQAEEERMKIQEQLIVTDRLASAGELSAGIAHEINNPLTTVVGFSQLLLKRDLPDDVREKLDLINREALRCANIARNLLTFARKHDTEKQLTNINDVIKNVLELRAYEQRVNNIKTDTKLDPNLPEITADGFQLQQVFINIIINAEHYMSEAHGKGTLTISTERVGNMVSASFVDDGPGIAEKALGHIFDPFFTTKEVGKGTGLGLSIAHGIITEHGGNLYAEGEPGKGATFIVKLPISKRGK